MATSKASLNRRRINIRNAQRGYADGDPEVTRLWNRTQIERMEIKDGQLAGVELKQPFASSFCWVVQIRKLWCEKVGGPGFEPGASQSRTLRTLVQNGPIRSTCIRNFSRADSAMVIWVRFIGGLLHEVVHETASQP